MSLRCELFVNKKYIEDLKYTDSKKLNPVSSKLFFNALGMYFPREIVLSTVIGLLDQKCASPGVLAFNQRLECWIKGQNSSIHPDDQKYLAHVVQLANAGQLRFS